MNKLPVAKCVQILSMLCEGVSMRSISRVADVSMHTVGKMLVDAGTVCAAFHDENVQGVKSKRVQVDEVWTFTTDNVPSMKKHVDGPGDTWMWAAHDADSKLIVQWFVGGRDAHSAKLFIDDLATRPASRVQLTSDGHRPYLDAIEDAFGLDIDYAMLVKLYGGRPETRFVEGRPDPAHISTFYAVRRNPTMPMHTRRFTSLTNALSKKFERHVHMVALYTAWYNWIRIHKTLRVTPAMAAGLTGKLMAFEDIVALMDARAEKPNRPVTYKKPAQISN
jgi:IS1 family transposase